LRALASLVAENDRYLLIVIGEGPDGPRLQALAAELQITKYVRWLGEIYDEEELAPWFRASTCFVYPGSVGLSLIQALGYGLPAITHDNRLLHNPEIAALEDGANGLTFPKGDHLALAGCIRRICGETRLRLQMSRCARKTIETRYSMAGMAERFVQAVRAAANTHGSDPAGAGNEPRAAGRV
jgi:glycosyltransferase involved in cell wall biosynthesis